MADTRLLSFIVTRRCLAAAYFVGTRLEHVELRRLDSNQDRAEGSLRSFINWLLSSLNVDLAVMKLGDQTGATQKFLFDVAKQAFRNEAVMLEIVDGAELLQRCAQPPFRTVVAFRRSIASFWPVLTGGSAGRFRLDAAGLGIYVQTQRLVDSVINTSPS